MGTTIANTAAIATSPRAAAELSGMSRSIILSFLEQEPSGRADRRHVPTDSRCKSRHFSQAAPVVKCRQVGHWGKHLRSVFLS